MVTELYLLRHGETEWTISGRHTGITEIPLTPNGEEEARAAGRCLKGVAFAHVFTSPRVRARRTVELAGFGAQAEVREELHEWIYGDYEGLLPAEIQKRHLGWDVFTHGCPNGETPAQAAERADKFLATLNKIDGRVMVVSHGHFSRVLAMRWAGLDVRHGHVLDSATASVSLLGFSKNSGKPLIKQWNRSVKTAWMV